MVSLNVEISFTYAKQSPAPLGCEGSSRRLSAISCSKTSEHHSANNFRCLCLLKGHAIFTLPGSLESAFVNYIAWRQFAQSGSLFSLCTLRYFHSCVICVYSFKCHSKYCWVQTMVTAQPCVALQEAFIKTFTRGVALGNIREGN